MLHNSWKLPAVRAWNILACSGRTATVSPPPCGIRCLCFNRRERISLDGSVQFGGLMQYSSAQHGISPVPHAPPISNEQLDGLVEIIGNAKQCLVLTGKGIIDILNFQIFHSDFSAVICMRSFCGALITRGWCQHRVQYPGLPGTRRGIHNRF